MKRCLLRLSLTLALGMFLASTALAQEPFGFFGVKSSLKKAYLESVGAKFVRGGIIYKKVKNKGFGKYDKLWGKVYSKGAAMVVTFESPTNIDKIRSPEYQEFIRRAVERYDGDEDCGCTEPEPDCYEPGDGQYPVWGNGTQPAVMFWQMENEVDVNPYWQSNAGYYAELTRIVYPLIKEKCPDCQVLLGSSLRYGLTAEAVGFYDDFAGQAYLFDIKDIHFFKRINKDHFAQLSAYLAFLDAHFATMPTPFWMTETSTYTDAPVKGTGGYRPFQSELEHAVEIVKRYVHISSLGVERILWNFLFEAQYGRADGFFWYTGLIYDGAGYMDKGKHVKKLGFYSYKKMVQKLADLEWPPVEELTGVADVYKYRFSSSSTPLYVVWWDWFKDTAETIDVWIEVPGLGPEVKVTEAVPAYDTGQEVPGYQGSFNKYTAPVLGGQVLLTLGKRPVYIEAAP